MHNITTSFLCICCLLRYAFRVKVNAFEQKKSFFISTAENLEKQKKGRTFAV